MTSQDDTEWTTIKLSCTADQEKRLQKLADDHQGGNKSALVRTAVEVYDAVIADSGMPLLAQIHQDVKDLQDTMDQLTKHLSESKDHPENQSQRDPTTLDQVADRRSVDIEQPGQSSLSAESEIFPTVQEVRSVLDQNPTEPHTVTEVIHATDLPPEQVPAALEYLVEEGVAIKNDEGERPKYRLAIEAAFNVN